METHELTVPERAAVALGTAEHEAKLIALSTKYADIIEIKNPAAREQCHSAYMELKSTRVAIQKAAKDAREDANQFSKAVIAEAERLTVITTGEEVRLQALRDDYDEEREREKQAKAAAEKARVDGIRARIDLIRKTPACWLNKPSHEISAAADHLSEVVISLDGWAEFAGEASVERDHAVKQMREMQSKQLEVEAEYQRLKAEREEIELKRLQLAAAERKAAAERAEQEAKDRETREREERRLQEIREEQEATRRAAQAAAEETMRRQQAEHEARMREQQAELARQQAGIDRQRAEQERVEQARQEAERRKREAEEAAQKIEADHAEALAENAAIDAARVAAEEALRKESERQARAEREAAAALESRLHALHFSPDALGMLEDILNEIAQPIGQECCGHPEYDHGPVCCGNAEAIFHDMQSLSSELNLWRNEMLRRAQHKEAA